MTRLLRGVAALSVLLAAPAVAQQGPIADRMLNLQGEGLPPSGSDCHLAGGNFLVTSIGTKLKSALDNSVPDNKRRLLHDGHDLALNTLQNGQAGSSKAWYFYGRVALQLGDLVAADSAFKRVVALTPGCAAEVAVYRQRAGATLIGAASAARSASQADSVMYFARAAVSIDPSRPHGWYMLGNGFVELQQNDSAAVFFRKAVEITSDSSPNAKTIRQAAAYTLGVIDYNERNFAEAAHAFDVALQLKPDDADARRNLAASLRQAGMADSAAKIEQALMSQAAGSEGGLTVAQLFDIGVGYFNAHNYADAATTFEKIVAVEPFNRDAQYNLAQSYFGMNDGDKLLPVALKLKEMDPLSFEVLQLVGAAYRLKHDQPNLLRAAEAVAGATVNVSAALQTGASSATLTLHAVGRQGRNAADRVIPPAAVPVVVEFLDKAGAVVATAEATVPALAPDATQDVTVTGNGAGIAFWRYHRK